MFRTMRRKKNEITAGEIEDLLVNERRGVLAVHGDDGYPYAVPINFYYDAEEQTIYFHGAKAGHKADALKKCDQVCFTVYGKETVKEEVWAPYVQSAVVFGRCHAVMDPSVALEKLKKFAMKYYPDEETVMEEIAASGKAVQVYAIVMEHVSGKQVQER